MFRIESSTRQALLRVPEYAQQLEARQRFLARSDERGQVVDPGGEPRGLFHPIYHWDHMPPIVSDRQRVWKEGRSFIYPIMLEGSSPPNVEHFEESGWSALRGGRVVVTPATAHIFPFENREVQEGQLDNAEIVGSRVSRIVIRGCQLLGCVFFRCTFRYVQFQDCSFRGSTFMGCRFLDCEVVAGDFSSTTWGRVENLDSRLANQVERVRVSGVPRKEDASGYGPAIFFDEAMMEREREALSAVRRARAAGKRPDRHSEARIKLWRL